MKVSREIWEAFQDLLAADTGTLAAVAAMHVHLVIAPFVPSLDLVIGDLTLATFTGSTPKNAGTGAQQVFDNPLAAGQRVVQILEPAGGWTWICTADPTPAETVYGWVLTDNTNADVYGSELLAAPVTIGSAGQGITVPNVRMSFLPTSPI